MNEEEQIEEAYKILYTTFFIIGVLIFIWLLLVIFSDTPTPGLEEINNEEYTA